MSEKFLNMQNIQDALSRRKSRNAREHQERLQKIYTEIPRIAEIDRELSSMNIQLAKNLILGNSSPLQDVTSQKERNRKLIDEKRTLLLQHGYEANYLDSIYTCSLCKDEGFDSVGHPCECVTRLRIEEFYRHSNLGKILESENFETFDLSYYSRETLPEYGISPYDNMKSKLSKAKRFVENFDSEHGNILIYGETGLGKTFLSNCIAKALLDTCHSVLYLSSNELFEKVLAAATFSQTPEDQTLLIQDYVYQAELLIIDDLGTELTNNFVVSQLFEIVNQRHLLGLSTLISTNLTLSQIRDQYSERIMSRFVESYDLYQIIGKNIRYQKHLV